MGGAVGARKDRPEIEAAVAAAEVHPLLCAVAQRTGDLSLLRDDFAPDQTQLLTPGRGLGPEQEEEARRLATEALLAHIESGAPEHTLTRDERQRVYGFLIGSESTDQWEGFLTEELALEGTDPRAPSWHLDELAELADSAEPLLSYRCAVIGAGASGLAAAYRLRQAGVAVTVFEKNADVGGTWLENVYPGCRVDVPNQLYSFSFAQTNDWASRFSAQPDLLAYLQGLAKALGLGACIRFRSEVTEARYDDQAHRWTLTVRTGTGTDPDADASETTEEFDAVVCAVGQLNRPSFPAIEGRETFTGESFHSAAWDDTIELAGRRVAVIGTGASAAQFVPLIAAETAHLDLFQRTPPWLLPTDNYGDPFPPEFHDLLNILPNYGRWDRLWQFWLMHEGLLVAARVDPEWDEHTEAVSAGNDFVRSMLLDVLRAQVTDDELYEKMVPHFPPFAKRALRDDGRWAAACSRPEVDLVTTPIAEITPTGVRTDRRRRPPGRRHHLRDRLHGVGLRGADARGRRRRCGAERGVGRRRHRVSRHHGPGFPELLHALRAEHQPRHQREHPHHGGVPGALRRRVDRPTPAHRAPRHVVPARRPRALRATKWRRATPRWSGASPTYPRGTATSTGGSRRTGRSTCTPTGRARSSPT